MLRKAVYFFIVTLVTHSIAFGIALEESAVEAVDGWTHTNSSGDEEAGIDLAGGRVTQSSPVIAELDGNIENGKEVVAAGYDGKIYAYHADGSLLWQTTAPTARCSSSPSRIISSPAVGKLHAGGDAYVVIGYGALNKRCDGGIIAINGPTGSIEWKFSTIDFSKKRKYGSILFGVVSSPGLADVDGDGNLEIGFGSFDRNVYLLNHDGSVRFYYNAADTVWSSPAFANLDSHPDLEMIIGTDISQNARLSPPTKNGGNVYAFKTKQNPKLHYGFRNKAAYLWMRPLSQVIFSAPSVGDVIPESPGNEIVVGSGCYFPASSNNKVGKWLKVLRGRDGKVLRTLTTEACSSSSPAIADIDGDGVNEIVATVNGATGIGGDGTSRIKAFKASSGAVLWSVAPKFNGRGYSWMGNFASPVIADINGDGSLEVLASTAAGVGVFNGADGSALSCQNGNCDTDPSLHAQEVLLSSPAVDDLDGDGDLEVVAAGAGDSGGAIYAWTGFSSSLRSVQGVHPSYSIPWGQYRGTSDHAGMSQ